MLTPKTTPHRSTRFDTVVETIARDIESQVRERYLMDILEELANRGAVLLDRHFVYKSGKHGPHYINMDPVFTDTRLMIGICHSLGNSFLDDEVDTVIGAATGAIPLVALTATAMTVRDRHKPPKAIAWADKSGDDFAFKRAGFADQLRDKPVLVVEDLLNTGDTVLKVISQARSHGANVIGASVVCNRGTETAQSLGVPRLEQLSSVNFAALDPNSCYLCADGKPIVEDIGHGDKYRLENPDYAGGYVNLLSG